MSPKASVPPIGQGLGFMAWEALYLALSAVSGRVENALKPHRITLPQLHLLVILDQEEDGELRVGEIGRRMVRASQTMTGLTDRAESCGWVEKIYDRPDRRTTTVAITAAGKEKLRKAWPTAAAVLDGICQLVEGSDDSVRSLRVNSLRSVCEELREAAANP